MGGVHACSASRIRPRSGGLQAVWLLKLLFGFVDIARQRMRFCVVKKREPDLMPDRPRRRLRYGEKKIIRQHARLGRMAWPAAGAFYFFLFLSSKNDSCVLQMVHNRI